MSLETSLAVGLVSPGSFVKLGLFSFDLYFFSFWMFPLITDMGCEFSPWKTL